MTSVIVQTRVQISVEDASGPLQMGAYVARPADRAQYPGVIVGFELFGVTAHVRDMTNRIAQFGYVAIAPDFHHRTAPGIELPVDADGRRRGFELLSKTSHDDIVQDVSATMHYLQRIERCRQKVAMVVLYPDWLSTTEIGISQTEPTLSLADGIAKNNGKLLLLIGEDNQLIKTQLRELGVDHELITYPAKSHGLFYAERETFQTESAAEAWRRIETALATSAK